MSANLKLAPAAPRHDNATPYQLSYDLTENQFNPVQRFGLYALVGFMFLSFSRAADFLMPSAHLPFILSSLALLCVIFSGGLVQALTSKVGFLLMAFSAWLVIAMPFSVWRGGSYMLITDQWVKSFMVFVLTAGLMCSLKDVKRIMYALAYASVVITILAYFFKIDSGDGRLYLSYGVLSNPNDTAQLLLTGLPFWFLMIINKREVAVRKPIAMIAIAAICYTILLTGSRGALAAITLMGLVVFWKTSMTSKIKWVAILALAGIAGLAVMPNTLRSRYLTMFGVLSETAGDADQTAIASREQRIYLFKQSLKFTIKNPVFGVGPGCFQIASKDESFSQNMRAAWRDTHNAFTQVSSEAGLPAFVFYFGAMFFCFRMAMELVRFARKNRGFELLGNMGYCQLLSLVGFAATSFFSSVAYHFYFPALAGITVGLYRSAQATARANGLHLGPTMHGMHQIARSAPATQPAPAIARNRFGQPARF
jgi:O-antigen ligase